MKHLPTKLLTVFLLLTTCLVFPAYAASGDFMGGSGTVTDPYIISNKTHLNNVRNYSDAHFRLVTDITFSADDFAEGGLFYNDGIGWQTIPSFSGTFDGNGHTISGLSITVNDPASGIVGLFGRNNGTIQSLNLVDVNYDVNRAREPLTASVIYIGGITAYNSGVIKNCSVQGTILSSSLTGSRAGQGTDGYLGGIAGTNSGTIQNCSNESNVQLTSRASSSTFSTVKYTGGIAGQNTGTISCCYNTGNIKYGQYSGGITGSNEYTLENCFNIGKIQAVGKDVEDTSYSGGICGTNTGSLCTSYNVGRVIGSTDSPCVSASTGVITNCFYYEWALDSDTFTDGLSLEQMSSEQAFNGYDFSSVWTFDQSLGYPFPVLRDMAQICLPEDNTTLFSGGNGTPWSPYLISTAEHFLNVEQFPEACYQLTGDISLSGASWTPLNFSGYFDGANYTIYNSNDYTISSSVYSDHSVALFDINSGFICNLNLSLNQQISFLLTHQNASINIGGLVASNSDGIIRNCNVDGSIYVDGSGYAFARVGGIAAENYSIIESCTNSALITADCVRSEVGGIAGLSSDRCAVISHCTNTANITSMGDRHGSDIVTYAGGITAYQGSGTISYCTNSGTITAKSRTYRKPGYGYDKVSLYAYAGGIAGRWYPGSNSSLPTIGVSDCTNIGKIDASATTSGVPVRHKVAFAGGICGNVGYEVSAGGLLGYSLEGQTKGQISRCKNSGAITSTETNIPVSTSSNSGQVYAGGISGACYGSITYCQNSGNALYAISAHYTTVSYCYNTGIADKGLSKSEPSYSYDAGRSSTSGSSLYRVNNDTCCYFLRDSASSSAHKYTNTYSELTMRTYSAYSGFDFKNDWIILPGSYSYPQLRNNLATPVKSIYIAEAPSAPLDCVEGYFSSYNGLKLGIIFEDGTSVITEPWDECFSLLDVDSMGTQTVALTVLNCQTEDTVEIIVREKGVASIFVLPTEETQLRYYKDAETIDLAGTLLYLIYDDTSVETVELSHEMVSGFIPGGVGTQTLTVTYGGKTCSFDITVYDVAAISIKELPTKTEYVQGQPINTAGGAITITYTDEETDEISLDAAELSYDQTATGTVTVTTSYEGKTTTFPITVRERKVLSISLLAEPAKLSYAPLENLDFTGSQLKVVFESVDNYMEILTLSDDMVTGFDNTSPGYQTLTVQYGDKTTNFLVHVQKLIKNSVYSTSSNGDIVLSIDISISKNVNASVIICAYQDGRAVNLFLTTETDQQMTFALNGSQAIDSCIMFVLDDAYRPLLEKQELPLLETQ